ncbi:glycosyltransferase [Candidatus Sumerlaeota bacterium]|nr:glycosyltransferase [Candidatus Sumerlaeota bacterium]
MRDIIHILGGLERGGIETWLMRCFRKSEELRQRSRVITTVPGIAKTGHYEELMQLGVPMETVAFSKSALPYIIRLRAALKRLKPRIVHSHQNYLCGLSTLAARMAGVPLRIAHYHGTYATQRFSLARRLYIQAARQAESATASLVIGCSQAALDSYPSPSWKNVARRVLYCGCELSEYAKEGDPAAIRDELQIADNALLIGTVGRLTMEKNHGFLIDIFAQLVKRRPGAMLIIAGDGVNRIQLEAKIQREGLQQKVKLLGSRDDIPHLLQAMDVFVFPSLYEGLPIAMLEAQIAGRPCVVSNRITAETDVVPELIERLSPEISAAEWADAILRAAGRSPLSRERAMQIVATSPHNIDNSIQTLLDTYSEFLK